MKAFYAFLFVLLISACSANPAALSASTYNRSAITNVRLGQSMKEVERVMGKEPESQSFRSLDGGQKEVRWYYLTDYGNEVNTEITFRQGRVVEIQATPWLGNGVFAAAPQKK